LRQIVGEGTIEEIFALLCKEIDRAKGAHT